MRSFLTILLEVNNRQNRKEYSITSEVVDSNPSTFSVNHFVEHNTEDRRHSVTGNIRKQQDGNYHLVKLTHNGGQTLTNTSTKQDLVHATLSKFFEQHPDKKVTYSPQYNMGTNIASMLKASMKDDSLHISNIDPVRHVWEISKRQQTNEEHR